MNRFVRTETATVYRAGGRRYLTKGAAYRAAARQLILEQRPCECERPEFDESGVTIMSGWSCELHSEWESLGGRTYLSVLTDRVAGLMMRADREGGANG